MSHNISNISEGTGSGKIIITSKDQVRQRRYLLLGKTIGISISESDDLKELGLGRVHLLDAMIETARYILALGGKLAYGGDIRRDGFTELLFDLLAYYKADSSLSINERLASFLAWPISLQLTEEIEANLIQNVSFTRVPPPADVEIEIPSEFLQPDSAKNLYVWARCLTAMREKMEAVCDARIFIGGRSKGFAGKLPGVMQELLIAVEQKHPVYLIGAFGGVTKNIIDALDGNSSDAFSTDYYFQNARYQEFFTMYNQTLPGQAIRYEDYFSTIKSLGFSGLSNLNGLSEEDNRRLATTPHVQEMIYLILKGLTNKFR